MEIVLEGRARRFGCDINTDYIVSSSRKRESLDPQVLRRYLFETLDPEFADSVKAGDILVADKNFGGGSAMEVAVTAVLGSGIRAVLAPSFARTYYRNAVNNGLIPLECDTSGIREGDRLSLALTAGSASIWIASQNQRIQGRAFPATILEILAAGGLVPYLIQHGDFQFG